MGDDKATLKLLGKTPPICPPCQDATAQASAADVVINFVDDNNGQIYCAGSIPFDGGDPGFVPPDANSAKCARLAATNLKKLAACMTKYDLKRVAAAVKGKPFDVTACRQGIGKPISCRAAYDKVSTKLLAKTPAICPPCLDAAAQSSTADLVMSFGAGNTAAIYCAGTAPLP